MGRRRRFNRYIASAQRAGLAVGRAGESFWRRSLQLRVVVSTLLLSFVVLLIVGFLLISQITGRLLDAKRESAVEQLDRGRSVAERVLATGDTSSSTQSQLARVRSLLTDQDTESSQSSTTVGSYDTVLLLPGEKGQPATGVGPITEISSHLQQMVAGGQVAYQYDTVERFGEQVPALIVGTPLDTAVPNLQLYMVFPLASEQNTVNLVRGTMLVGGIVLLGLLAAIAWLVARQVVAPLRSASRIAVRFADGRLTERMEVRGDDEFAHLAMSFNDMAESLSRQISHLEEFGGLQRQFTSDVSHELRTPLTTVRMAADLLYDSRDELDPLQRRSVELLDKELDR
ncbi:MAG: HAMP domain-containing sensor histidine kinase, partial [Gordonia sp. (in: high G+C Gram-positive bacteria)]